MGDLGPDAKPSLPRQLMADCAGAEAPGRGWGRDLTRPSAPHLADLAPHGARRGRVRAPVERALVRLATFVGTYFTVASPLFVATPLLRVPTELLLVVGAAALLALPRRAPSRGAGEAVSSRRAS